MIGCMHVHSRSLCIVRIGLSQRCNQYYARHNKPNTQCEAKRHASFAAFQNSLSPLAVQELLSLRSHRFFLQGVQKNV